MLTAERAIHAAVFALLLIGLCTLSGWVLYNYVNEFVLKLAGITLSWGIILLALYVVFKKLNWHFWS
jgi:hypothetical protein